ncbi:Spore germination protein YndE [compost metagenome]
MITPAGLASLIKQDAWIAPLISLGPGLLLVLLYTLLNRLVPEKNYVELSRLALGKVLGTIASLLFILFSFLASSMVLYDVGKFMTSIIMPETPILFVNALFILLSVFAIRNGLDSLAMMVELLFPIFSFLFILMIAFTSPQMNFHNVLPFMEADAPLVLKAVAHVSTIAFMPLAFMPLVTFLMIHPSVSNYRPSALIKSVITGGLLSFIIVAATILVLGYSVTALQEYPVYHLAQKISIGRFLERIEVMVASMWLITTFVKMTIYFYSAVSGLSVLIKLSNEKAILLPLGFLMLIISVDVYPNAAFEEKFDTTAWVAFVFLVGVLMPLIFYLSLLFRNKWLKAPKNKG